MISRSVVSFVDVESLAHAVSHTDPEIIPAIMPPPVVHRKYTDVQIERLLDTFEKNVYVNNDLIPSRFKSSFTKAGDHGKTFNNLNLLIDTFLEKGVFGDFKGDTKKFSCLLKDSKDWKPGPFHYKNSAREHMQSLNI